jgi:hypothetical protein
MESWFGTPLTNGVTSRIWQRYKLDLSVSDQNNLKKATGQDQQSNPSTPGPGIWRISGKMQKYEENILKPRGELSNIKIDTPTEGKKNILTQSWYGGENHAVHGSKEMQKVSNGLHPTIKFVD